MNEGFDAEKSLGQEVYTHSQGGNTTWRITLKKGIAYSALEIDCYTHQHVEQQKAQQTTQVQIKASNRSSSKTHLHYRNGKYKGLNQVEQGKELIKSLLTPPNSQI